MATNRPVASSSRVSPVSVSRSVTPVTLSSPWIVGDLGVPGELDLRVGEGALLHDLGGAQLAAAVDQGDLGAEAGQEGGLLDRGVATADDGDVLLAEEEAVAGRAPADAVAGEPVLVGQAELAVARAHGQDHGAGGEGALGGA